MTHLMREAAEPLFWQSRFSSFSCLLSSLMFSCLRSHLAEKSPDAKGQIRASAVLQTSGTKVKPSGRQSRVNCKHSVAYQSHCCMLRCETLQRKNSCSWATCPNLRVLAVFSQTSQPKSLRSCNCTESSAAFEFEGHLQNGTVTEAA